MDLDNFVAIDFETANGARSSVCSVGLAFVEGGRFIGSEHRLIRPRPNFYTYWTTQIHGMTEADTDEALDFPDVWQELESMIGALPLVAHNSPFDEGCLKSVHQLYGMSYPDYQFLCTCRAARRAYPHLPNHKLNTVSAYVGYNLENHHNAQADAEACAEIAIRLFCGCDR